MIRDPLSMVKPRIDQEKVGWEHICLFLFKNKGLIVCPTQEWTFLYSKCIYKTPTGRKTIPGP